MKKTIVVTIFGLIALLTSPTFADVSEPKIVNKKINETLNFKPMPAPKLFISIASIIKPEEEIDEDFPWEDDKK